MTKTTVTKVTTKAKKEADSAKKTTPKKAIVSKKTTTKKATARGEDLVVQQPMIISTTFNVEMVCGGCSGAVNHVLGKIDGIEEVMIDLEGQKVHVTHAGSVDPRDILGKLKKWGDSANRAVGLAEE